LEASEIEAFHFDGEVGINFYMPTQKNKRTLGASSDGTASFHVLERGNLLDVRMALV
jgi:hypothetical protein